MMFPSRQHLNLFSGSFQSSSNNGAAPNDLQAAASRAPLAAAAAAPGNLTVQEILQDARRRSQLLPFAAAARPAVSPATVLSGPNLASSLLPTAAVASPSASETARRLSRDAELLNRSRQIETNARLLNDALLLRGEREAAMQALLQSEQHQRSMARLQAERLESQAAWGAGLRTGTAAVMPPAAATANWHLSASTLVCGSVSEEMAANAMLRNRLAASAALGNHRLSPNTTPPRVASPIGATTLPASLVAPRSPRMSLVAAAAGAGAMDPPAKPAASAMLKVAPEAPLPNALGIEQDTNWLSENQCVLRAEFIEVTKATRKDFSGLDGSAEAHNYEQVGIRCRYCAHVPSGQRASRSSAFPSSITQLYQSFTMMQRDHFHKCTMIPVEKRRHLETLRRSNTQGACDSKQYWTYAAKTLGMFDTPRGIEMSQEAIDAGRAMANFGVGEGTEGQEDAKKQAASEQEEEGEELLLCSLVHPDNDKRLHPFLGHLLKQLQVVKLLPSEKTGKRKALPIGFTGLGCRCCSRAGRLGFSRTFPLRRRTLPAKLDDMFSHLMRCPLTPPNVKAELLMLHGSNDERKRLYQKHHNKLDQLWSQLGRDGDFTA